MTDNTKTCKLKPRLTNKRRAFVPTITASQSQPLFPTESIQELVRNQWPTRGKLYASQNNNRQAVAARCDKPKIKQNSQSAGIIRQLRVPSFIKPLEKHKL